MTDHRWPETVWLARHGESAANVARDRAEAQHVDVIDIDIRDMDVDLSPRGDEQARALGLRLRETPTAERPAVVLCSPYVRAEQTARIALQTAGMGDVDVFIDDRLREREFGMLDRLTRSGIADRFPEQARARAFLGKFYHRPPGGESWCDVALRLRSVLDTLSRDHRGERVLLVTHQVVILMFRYLIEHMTEAQILAIDRSEEVANCSLTIFDYDAGAGRRGDLVLRVFNDVSHVEQSRAEVTAEPDVPSAAR